MRKNHTYRNFYKNAVDRERRTSPYYKGRVGHNMSRAKALEYSDLIWYLNFYEFNEYGWMIPVYRLMKNLKYRKNWIKAVEERLELKKKV
jgi:hypothetical protein